MPRYEKQISTCAKRIEHMSQLCKIIRTIIDIQTLYILIRSCKDLHATVFVLLRRVSVIRNPIENTI